MEVGEEGDYIPILHSHHQNDAYIKMGSDESHFNVSLLVRDKVTRQCPQTTTFEEKGEPKRYRTEVRLLTSLTPYCQAKPCEQGGGPALSFDPLSYSSTVPNKPYGFCGHRAP